MSVRPPLHAFVATTLLAACLSSTAPLPARGDSLNPHVIGGLRDSLPLTGQANLVATSPFIYNNSTNGQHRAIVEYDVSALPRGTVISASLTGRVGPNNSLDTGVREHLIEVYTGNGVVDLADYALPGIEAGRFSHAAGQATLYDLDVTGILHNLLAAGADFIGMRVSPVSANMPPDVLSASFPPPVLNFDILPAGARMVDLLPTFDARVRRETAGGAYTLVEGELALTVQEVDFVGIDRRAILEYDIGAIPDNADLTDAKIVYQVNSFTSSSDDSAQPLLYGYVGNGVAEQADGFRTTRQIGVSDPVETLGPVTVDIDHEYIQSLLATSSHFGVAMLGDANSNQFGFAAKEFSPTYAPAMLKLTYTIPPNPADFNQDNVVNAADLTRWKGAFAVNATADADNDGDSDGGDFLAWQRQLGAAGAVGSTVAVPEPAAFGLSFAGAAFLRRRKRAAP